MSQGEHFTRLREEKVIVDQKKDKNSWVHLHLWINISLPLKLQSYPFLISKFSL